MGKSIGKNFRFRLITITLSLLLLSSVFFFWWGSAGSIQVVAESNVGEKRTLNFFLPDNNGSTLIIWETGLCVYHNGMVMLNVSIDQTSTSSVTVRVLPGAWLAEININLPPGETQSSTFTAVYSSECLDVELQLVDPSGNASGTCWAEVLNEGTAGLIGIPLITSLSLFIGSLVTTVLSVRKHK